MALEIRRKTQILIKHLSLFGIVSLLSIFSLSCAFTEKTLATFDLGKNLSLRITRSNLDPNLPIYCEVLLEGKTLRKEVIEYEGVLLDYNYQIFGDSSNNKFALIQLSPHKTQPEVIFDLDNVKSPLICNKYNQELNRLDGDVCKRNANQIMEVIEENNPDLRLNRFNNILNTKVENYDNKVFK